MNNLIPRKLGGLANRDGSVPLTAPAIGAIKTLNGFRKSGTNNILATSGTTLYKYASGAFTAQTMTNALSTADIDAAQFRDQNGNEVLVIADGGSLKYYNGTAVVNITPAANDASPLPPNALGTINSGSPAVGVLVHNNRLVVWPNNSDTIFNSKPGFYDYFESTSFQRFVRENDYIVTCVSFSGALVVLMRRHIAVRFGDGYSSPPVDGDWSQDFLDTTDGCINAKSVQTVVYPDGSEEIFYQSDRGIHAIYTINTIELDASAHYSTRSVSRYQIDFAALGVSKSEWSSAVSYFRDGRYWLIYKVGSSYKGLVFDTNDKQWYPVSNVKADCFYGDEDYFYFAGTDGLLKMFDSTLYQDYDNTAKSSGTPVSWHWYSKLMTPKLTGYDHFWDVLMLETKQFPTASTIDIEVNTYSGRFQQTSAIKTEIFIVGASKIGEAEIANANLTDIINNAKRIETFLKGQYAQVKISNSRGEPGELYNLSYEVRLMTKY
jgi:hypothetical protein